MKFVTQPFRPPFLATAIAVLTAFLPLITKAADHGPRVARMLWQDRDKGILMWGEVHVGEKWVITASPVKGFPKLNTEKQHLGQMEQAEGLLLAGVRDTEDGTYQSGWVAVDTGVREQPHGDHSHWNFVASPSVRSSQLDAEQGNPGHLSLYNGNFYIANDKKNGFTQISPKDLASKPAKDCGKFFTGGGNLITMAVVNNSVAYSTWMDGDGPNRGRVDVVNLKKVNGDNLTYSFSLPAGAISGATVNSGKVFFASAGDIFWVEADPELKKSTATVVVHSLAPVLETGSENTNRATTFANLRNWVLFAMNGAGGQSSLRMVDASGAQPKVITLPIQVADGLSLTSPKVVLASGGKRYAFLFQDRFQDRKESEIQEQLTIVDLDPNGDRNLSDARIVKTIPVGASKVSDDRGHHSVSFDSEGRLACFTNPGEGTIWVMSLRDLTVRAKGLVGGTPGEIVALGAPEHKH